MHKMIVVLGALALASCGSSNPDFTITVTGEPSAVKQHLAAVKTTGFGSESAISTAWDDGDLLFIIPAAENYDDGEIRMAFTPNGTSTAIAVTVDIPMVPMDTIGEPNMVLSEEKVETELKRVMQQWGESYSTFGSGADTGDLGFTMAAVSFAAQLNDPEEALRAAAFLGSAAGDGGWNADDNGGWGSDAAASQPESGGWGSDTPKSNDAGWGTDS